MHHKIILFIRPGRGLDNRRYNAGELITLKEFKLFL